MTLPNDVIELLQSALLDEAHAILQYRLHALRALPVCTVPFNDVAEHLEEHADSEEGHYKRLYDHLRRNGVEPKFGNDALIHYSDDTNDIVKAHQEAERGAIDTYTKLTKMTETEGLEETNQLVQDILNDEIEHLDDFTRYSDLEVLQRNQGERTASTQEKSMSQELKFATKQEALQHLAEITGQRVVIAAPAPVAPTKPSAPPKPGKTSPSPSHTPGKQPRTVPLPQPKNCVAKRELEFASINEALACFADMTNATVRIAKTMENFRGDRGVSPEAAKDLEKSLQEWVKKHNKEEAVTDVANRIKKHLTE